MTIYQDKDGWIVEDKVPLIAAISPNQLFWKCPQCHIHINFPEEWADDKRIQVVLDHKCKRSCRKK